MEEIYDMEDDRICILCKKKLKLEYHHKFRPLFALTYYALSLLGGKDVRAPDIAKKLGFKHRSHVHTALQRLKIFGIVKVKKGLEDYTNGRFKKGSPITYWTITKDRPAYIKRAEEWLAKNDIKFNL